MAGQGKIYSPKKALNISTKESFKKRGIIKIRFR
jgi:hypothetical protein